MKTIYPIVNISFPFILCAAIPNLAETNIKACTQRPSGAKCFLEAEIATSI
jgi:hypothetical protein